MSTGAEIMAKFEQAALQVEALRHAYSSMLDNIALVVCRAKPIKRYRGRRARRAAFYDKARSARMLNHFVRQQPVDFCDADLRMRNLVLYGNSHPEMMKPTVALIDAWTTWQDVPMGKEDAS